MKTILFVDFLSYKPYNAATLQNESLAGTEATVTRIAEGLGQTYNIYVAQGAREKDEYAVSNAHYISIASAKTLKTPPDVLIVLRKYQRFDEIAKLYPKAKKYLWMHTIPKKSLRKYAGVLRRHQASIIAVSRFHANLIQAILRKTVWDKLLRRKTIPVIVKYNPLSDTLQPDNTKVLMNKLIFLSSPIKGLEQVLQHFRALRKLHPEFTLFIADPGYRIKKDTFSRANLEKEPGIKVLGSLAHEEVIQHLRETFCVFYPQNQFEETFGLIFAEANAVGTPVLTHDIGAANEVLSNKAQIIDVEQSEKVINTLIKWRENGRPKVYLPDQFRLSRVLEEWMALLG